MAPLTALCTNFLMAFFQQMQSESAQRGLLHSNTFTVMKESNLYYHKLYPKQHEERQTALVG